MPELKRDFFSAYYSADPAHPNVFYGIEVYHSVYCGAYTDTDGNPRALMHYTLCKDDLPDTQGSMVEMCDFAMLYGDLDNQPIMAALLIDPQAALTMVHPVVAVLLMQDFAEGLDAFAIAERRAGVLVPEFLGFTLTQVLEVHPGIYQPTVDDEGNLVANITRCSLEQA